MSGNEIERRVADGLSRRGPNLPTCLITQVNNFTRGVTDGSFDRGVSWFSRLLTDHVEPLPSAETWKPNEGLATTFTHGAGVI